MGFGETMPAEVERVAAEIVDAAYKVHRALGPGLLESVHEICLAHELQKRGLRVERQVEVALMYDGVRIDAALRIDLLVEDCVIVELKAVEKHNPLFEAQVLTYLKLTGKQLGFLINFNVELIKQGMKRIVMTKKRQ